MSQPEIVALVPMRHSSERVPGKNYRSFAGKPLYHRIIETLLGCPEINLVCLDTDSPTIIEDAKVHFPQVKILLRPESLRDGAIPMNQVLLNSVKQVPADLYLQTHSTNPLLKSETVSQAIKAFLAQSQCDSLFSVTCLQTRLYDGNGRPVNHNPNVLLRTQDLPPLFEENSNLYLFPKSVLEQRHNRLGEHPMLFEIAREESWDIDEEIDFRVAEFLYQQRES